MSQRTLRCCDEAGLVPVSCSKGGRNRSREDVTRLLMVEHRPLGVSLEDVGAVPDPVPTGATGATDLY